MKIYSAQHRAIVEAPIETWDDLEGECMDWCHTLTGSPPPVKVIEWLKQHYHIPIKQQVSEEDKEPLPQQEEDKWKEPTYRALYNSLRREKSLQSQLSEALAKIKSQEAEIAELRKQVK